MEYIQCINGHYYDATLKGCPYCNRKDNTMRFLKCKNGHFYNPVFKKCPYCSEEPSEPKRSVPTDAPTLVLCPRCGSELNRKDEKCPFCGAPLDWAYNDYIDSECSELILYPAESIKAYWYDVIDIYKKWLTDFHREAPLDKKEQNYWFAALTNDIDKSNWYYAMHAYIDAYTKKIIERRHCNKYGLPELDEAINKLSSHEGKEYNKIFGAVKSAIIRQDYGLEWFSPESINMEVCPSCGKLNDPNYDNCSYCGIPHDWKYNDYIDPECAKWFPEFCTLGGHDYKPTPDEIADRMHLLKEQALKKRIENSEWYSLMRMYIDEYTMKIIERKQCYKYGLSELDENTENLKANRLFWKLKKAIIWQDYGLNWNTPEEQFEVMRGEYLYAFSEIA